MSHTVLIIDDEADIRNLLGDIFTDENYNVLKAAHSEQAFSLIADNVVDLIVLDIWLENSDMDGMEILKNLKRDQNLKHIPVLMISGHGNVEMAVNAMKDGAYDFIEKPFQIDHMMMTVERVLEQKNLYDENARLKNRSDRLETTHDGLSQFRSESMHDLSTMIEDNKKSDARVLITGEGGTGKLRLAKLLIEQSSRSKKSVHVIHGHDLTAANIDDVFTKAEEGTLIIQSIEGCDQETQSSLLKKASSQDTLCRIISLSDEKLDKAVENQKFSSTLYDRLSVIKLDVPPLRNRKEDIPILVSDIIKDICDDLLAPEINIDMAALQYVSGYDWPGNIKQLKLAMEWAVMNVFLADKQSISRNDLLFLGVNADEADLSNQDDDNIHYISNSEEYSSALYDTPIKQAREQFEKNYLTNVLHKFNGNIAKMADHIEMERTALHRKLKSLEISYSPDLTKMAIKS